MSDVIKLFEHPCYADYADDWITYRDLYEAKHATLVSTRYLVPHELEIQGTVDSNKIRKVREQRTRYANMMEPILSRYTSLFFKQEPEIDAATTKLFGEAINDVTGTGKHLVTFIKDDILKNLILYGRPIVLVDAPMYKPASKAEQIQKKFSPTLEILSPLCVKDWEVLTDGEGKGRFKHLRYEYEIIEPRVSLLDPPKVNLYSKILSFDYASKLYQVLIFKAKDYNHKAPSSNVDWETVGTFDFREYYRLPVSAILTEESWVKDAAQEMLRGFNLVSSRDNIHLYQAHQRTYINGVNNEEQRMALAEYTIGFLPEGSTVQTVEATNTDSIDQNIAESKANIFSIAFNLQRVLTLDSNAVEGAATQREAKEQLVSLIKSEILTLENLVNDVVKDYAFFKEGIIDFKGKITLASDIKLEDIDSIIGIYSAFRDEINRVPTWRKETLKQVVDVQQLANADDIKQEIDNSSNPVQPNTQRATLLESLTTPVNG